MIKINNLEKKDLKKLWEIAFSKENPEWKKWDAPYFDDYNSMSFDEFINNINLVDYFLSNNLFGIFLSEKLIGIVTYHWEDKKTLWLEIGIVIYLPEFWNGGYGPKALQLLLDFIFKKYQNLEHVGLTTWSGNVRMMKAAEKIGMIEEAKIRKVRYYNGIYYDSMKYGILREEWNMLTK